MPDPTVLNGGATPPKKRPLWQEVYERSLQEAQMQAEAEEAPTSIFAGDAPPPERTPSAPAVPTNRPAWQETSALATKLSGRTIKQATAEVKRAVPGVTFSTVGQGNVHQARSWDHTNAADVAVNPNSDTGRKVMAELDRMGIPYLPATGKESWATGPHIHMGDKSTRASKPIPRGTIGTKVYGSAPPIPRAQATMTPEEWEADQRRRGLWDGGKQQQEDAARALGLRTTPFERVVRDAEKDYVEPIDRTPRRVPSFTTTNLSRQRQQVAERSAPTAPRFDFSTRKPEQRFDFSNATPADAAKLKINQPSAPVVSEHDARYRQLELEAAREVDQDIAREAERYLAEKFNYRTDFVPARIKEQTRVEYSQQQRADAKGMQDRLQAKLWPKLEASFPEVAAEAQRRREALKQKAIERRRSSMVRPLTDEEATAPNLMGAATSGFLEELAQPVGAFVKAGMADPTGILSPVLSHLPQSTKESIRDTLYPNGRFLGRSQEESLADDPEAAVNPTRMKALQTAQHTGQFLGGVGASLAEAYPTGMAAGMLTRALRLPARVAIPAAGAIAGAAQATLRPEVYKTDESFFRLFGGRGQYQRDARGKVVVDETGKPIVEDETAGHLAKRMVREGLVSGVAARGMFRAGTPGTLAQGRMMERSLGGKIAADAASEFAAGTVLDPALDPALAGRNKPVSQNLLDTLAEILPELVRVRGIQVGTRQLQSLQEGIRAGQITSEETQLLQQAVNETFGVEPQLSVAAPAAAADGQATGTSPAPSPAATSNRATTTGDSWLEEMSGLLGQSPTQKRSPLTRAEQTRKELAQAIQLGEARVIEQATQAHRAALKRASDAVPVEERAALLAEYDALTPTKRKSSQAAPLTQGEVSAENPATAPARSQPPPDPNRPLEAAEVFTLRQSLSKEEVGNLTPAQARERLRENRPPLPTPATDPNRPLTAAETIFLRKYLTPEEIAQLRPSDARHLLPNTKPKAPLAAPAPPTTAPINPNSIQAKLQAIKERRAQQARVEIKSSDGLPSNSQISNPVTTRVETGNTDIGKLDAASDRRSEAGTTPSPQASRQPQAPGASRPRPLLPHERYRLTRELGYSAEDLKAMTPQRGREILTQNEAKPKSQIEFERRDRQFQAAVQTGNRASAERESAALIELLSARKSRTKDEIERAAIAERITTIKQQVRAIPAPPTTSATKPTRPVTIGSAIATDPDYQEQQRRMDERERDSFWTQRAEESSNRRLSEQERHEDVSPIAALKRGLGTINPGALKGEARHLREGGIHGLLSSKSKHTVNDAREWLRDSGYVPGDGRTFDDLFDDEVFTFLEEQGTTARPEAHAARHQEKQLADEEEAYLRQKAERVKFSDAQTYIQPEASSAGRNNTGDAANERQDDPADILAPGIREGKDQGRQGDDSSDILGLEQSGIVRPAPTDAEMQEMAAALGLATEQQRAYDTAVETAQIELGPVEASRLIENVENFHAEPKYLRSYHRIWMGDFSSDAQQKFQRAARDAGFSQVEINTILNDARRNQKRLRAGARFAKQDPYAERSRRRQGERTRAIQQLTAEFGGEFVYEGDETETRFRVVVEPRHGNLLVKITDANGVFHSFETTEADIGAEYAALGLLGVRKHLVIPERIDVPIRFSELPDMPTSQLLEHRKQILEAQLLFSQLRRERPISNADYDLVTRERQAIDYVLAQRGVSLKADHQSYIRKADRQARVEERDAKWAQNKPAETTTNAPERASLDETKKPVDKKVQVEQASTKEAWQMTKAEFARSPFAHRVPKGILTLHPKDMTAEKLNEYSNAELEALSLVMAVSKTGTKVQKVARLVDAADLRLRLAEETQEGLLKLKNAELIALGKRAGIYTGTNKYGLAVGLINWRNSVRSRGQAALADANHYNRVERALFYGQPVPEEVLKDYPHLKAQVEQEKVATAPLFASEDTRTIAHQQPQLDGAKVVAETPNNIVVAKADGTETLVKKDSAHLKEADDVVQPTDSPSRQAQNAVLVKPEGVKEKSTTQQERSISELLGELEEGRTPNLSAAEREAVEKRKAKYVAAKDPKLKADIARLDQLLGAKEAESSPTITANELTTNRNFKLPKKTKAPAPNLFEAQEQAEREEANAPKLWNEAKQEWQPANRPVRVGDNFRRGNLAHYVDRIEVTKYHPEGQIVIESLTPVPIRGLFSFAQFEKQYGLQVERPVVESAPEDQENAQQLGTTREGSSKAVSAADVSATETIGATNEASGIGAGISRNADGTSTATGSTATRSAESGDARTDRTDERSGTGRSRNDDGVATTADEARQTDTTGHRNNVEKFQDFVITDPAKLNAGTRTKYKQNVAALRLLKELEAQRRQATPEEQEVLSLYSGWGQFPGVFNTYLDPNAYPELTGREDVAPDKWAKEREEVQSLLTPEEFEAARRSTLNAHYTSPELIGEMWQMMRRIGFTGGRVLEPSMGVGSFFGLMPAELRSQSRLTGIELDRVTAAIAKQLYPNANVQQRGFETLNAPDGFFDLAIGNVPFGDYQLSDRRYKSLSPAIHNYFFLKSLDKVRPGGIVAFITSTGTMDAANAKRIREVLAAKADLVAAMRFPSETFAKSAGTSVVTDLIILRKRLDGEKSNGTAWVNTKEIPNPDGGMMKVNEYFADHPNQALGVMDQRSKMYKGRNHVTRTADFEQRLQKAIEGLPENVFTPRVQSEAFKEDAALLADKSDKLGALVEHKGKIYRNVKGELVEEPLSATNLDKVKRLLDIGNRLNEVFASQLSNQSPAQREGARMKLNAGYDAFVKKYGPISNNSNIKLFGSDPNFPKLLALEIFTRQKGVAEKKQIARKSDIFFRDTITPKAAAGAIKTPADAIAVQLRDDGRLNLEAAAKALQMEPERLAKEWVEKGLAYNNPRGSWESVNQYLSGNVRRKLVEAKEAAAIDPQYNPNIEALEKVQPKDVSFTDINVRIGAPWQTVDDVRNFMAESVGVGSSIFEVSYEEARGKWFVSLQEGAGRDVYAAMSKFSTRRMNFVELMRHALDGTQPTVYDKIRDGIEVNQDETQAARNRLVEIKEAFGDWIWKDDARRVRLERDYNDLMNNINHVEVSAEHLRDAEGFYTLPGMNPALKLRPVQAQAVWMGVRNGRALFAHEVGLGKTYTLIATAMEMKRLGHARKPMIVVQASTLGGFVRDARYAYPSANILAAPAEMTALERNTLMSRVATGNYDMIVVTHDNFDALRMSPEYEQQFLNEQLAELEDVILSAKEERDNRLVKELENRKAKLEERLQESLNTKKDNTVFFDQLGVDALLVDEFHRYKSLPIYTTMKVRGIPHSDSARATTTLMKTDWLMEQNNGRGLIAATGTPISNTLVEMYVLQRFLQAQEMRESGIQSFDGWARTFADTVTEGEMKATGEFKSEERLSRFTNLPELQTLARQVIDVKFFADSGDSNLVRPEPVHHIVEIPLSRQQKKYMQEIKKRAANMPKDRSIDNFLKLSTDAKNMAMDIRLVKPSARATDNKAKAVVTNVLRLLKERPDMTQMIFSDMAINPSSSSGATYTVYDDIIEQLVAGGVPREKIVNFRDLDKADKQRAIERLNTHEAWIGIGSTEKMGTGVNAQTYLTALHHVDVTWVPSAYHQRNGRGIRQGNKNTKIDVFQYIVPGSFDSVMWSALNRKDRFQQQFLRGENVGREMEEEPMEEFSFATVAAVASGNPDLKRKAELDQSLMQLERSERVYRIEQSSLRLRIPELERMIQRREADLTKAQKVREWIDALPKDQKFLITLDGKPLDSREAAGIAIVQAMHWRESGTDFKQVGEYKGLEVWVSKSLAELRHANLNVAFGFNVNPEKPAGATLSMDAALRNYDGPQVLQDDINAMTVELQQRRDALGKPFKQAEKLEKARLEMRAVMARLDEWNRQQSATVQTGDANAKLSDEDVREIAEYLRVPLFEIARVGATWQGIFDEIAKNRGVAETKSIKEELLREFIWDNPPAWTEAAANDEAQLKLEPAWGKVPMASYRTVGDAMADARVTRRDSDRSRTLYMNEQARLVVSQAYVKMTGDKRAEDMAGVNLGWTRANRLASYIRAQKSLTPNETAHEQLENIAQALEAEAKRGKTVVLATFSGERLLTQTKATVREENFHAWQTRIGGRTAHLVNAAWFKAQPHAQRIREKLAALKYQNHEMATEAAAHIAAGDYDSVGLSRDEALEFLTAYFEEVAARHGSVGFQYLKRVHPDVKALVEQHADFLSTRNRGTNAGTTQADLDGKSTQARRGPPSPGAGTSRDRVREGAENGRQKDSGLRPGQAPEIDEDSFSLSSPQYAVPHDFNWQKFGQQMMKALSDLHAKGKLSDKRKAKIKAALTAANAAVQVNDGVALNKALRDLNHHLTPRSFMVADFFRPINASGELSYIGRQGGIGLMTHPGLGAQAINDARKAFTELGYDKAMTALRNRENRELAEAANVDFGTFAELDYGRGTLSQEENTLIGALSRIPGLRNLEYFNRIYMDTLRMNIFDSRVARLKKRGEPLMKGDKPHPYLQAWAKEINIITGRGNLNEYGRKFADVTSLIGYSPRLMISRFQYLDATRLYRMAKTDKQAALEAATDMAKFWGVVGTLVGIALAAGLELKWEDPDDADWMKARFGNFRYSLIPAGMNSYARFSWRMMKRMYKGVETGEIATEAGKGWETTKQFARQKEAPMASFIHDQVLDRGYVDNFGRKIKPEYLPQNPAERALLPQRGFSAIGEPRRVFESLTDKTVQLFYQNLYEAARDEGLTGFLMTLPEAIGADAQYYKDRSAKIENIPYARRQWQARGYGDWRDTIWDRGFEKDDTFQPRVEKRRPVAEAVVRGVGNSAGEQRERVLRESLDEQSMQRAGKLRLDSVEKEAAIDVQKDADWASIVADPRYQKLSDEEKKKMRQNFTANYARYKSEVSGKTGRETQRARTMPEAARRQAVRETERLMR